MLTDLIAAGHERAMIRRLQEFMPAIEQCVAAGFRHKAIHGWLVGAGLEMDFRYYLNALARLRKAAAREGLAGPAAGPREGAEQASSSDQTAARTAHTPDRQQRASQAKAAGNSAGIRRGDTSARGSIAGKQMDRKPFEYDPTAADKLDLKHF